MTSESALSVRFGQLAWFHSVADINALHKRFGWEHPMDGDYLISAAPATHNSKEHRGA